MRITKNKLLVAALVWTLVSEAASAGASFIGGSIAYWAVQFVCLVPLVAVAATFFKERQAFEDLIRDELDGSDRLASMFAISNDRPNEPLYLILTPRRLSIRSRRDLIVISVREICSLELHDVDGLAGEQPRAESSITMKISATKVSHFTRVEEVRPDIPNDSAEAFRDALQTILKENS